MNALLPVCLLAIAQASAGAGKVESDKSENLGGVVRRSEVHMGSSFTISLHAADRQQAESAFKAAFARIGELDDALSDFDSKSELSRLSAASGDGQWRLASPDLWKVLRASVAWSRRTNGAFDVTVGPLTKLWRRARRQQRLPPRRRAQEALAAVGYQSIEFDSQQQAVRLTKPNMRLDLGGIAKGYAADAALAALRAKGISRALVNAGGDIVAGDPPPGRPGWRIGVVLLEQNAEPSRVLLLENGAIATSGDAWQFVEIDNMRYSHLINPRTGLGLTERIAVTVVAPDCTTADALASSVSVLGKQKGLALINNTPGAEALVVEARGDEVVVSESNRFPPSD